MTERALIMKYVRIILVTLLIAASGFSFWLFKHLSTSNKKLFVTTNPTTRTLVQYVTASGTLKVEIQISIGSLITGRIKKWIADDNDLVKKDQTLAIIDNGIGDSAVKKLTAALAIAQEQANFQRKFFARQNALYQAGQLSQNAFEQYRQDCRVAIEKVNQTAAELEIENKTYQNLFIRSPEDGIVIARKIDLGQMVASQFNATVLYELGKDLTRMEAYVDVEEADIGMIKEGQICDFTVDAFPKRKFQAMVKRVEFQAKIIDNVVTYATILSVNNPELKLRPGMTTNVDIKVAEAENRLAIPNKCMRISTTLLEALAKKYNLTLEQTTTKSPKGPKGVKFTDEVWVVMSPTHLKQVEISTGITDGRYTEVTGGIDAKSAVIESIEEIIKDNAVLKGMFGGSSIGKK
jgi:HlyD family secretion protein